MSNVKKESLANYAKNIKKDIDNYIETKKKDIEKLYWKIYWNKKEWIFNYIINLLKGEEPKEEEDNYEKHVKGYLGKKGEKNSKERKLCKILKIIKGKKCLFMMKMKVKM